MTLGTLYFGNCGTVVYQRQAGFFSLNSTNPEGNLKGFELSIKEFGAFGSTGPDSGVLAFRFSFGTFDKIPMTLALQFQVGF